MVRHFVKYLRRFTVMFVHKLYWPMHIDSKRQKVLYCHCLHAGTLVLNALRQNRYMDFIWTNSIGDGCEAITSRICHLEWSRARRLRWFDLPDWRFVWSQPSKSVTFIVKQTRDCSFGWRTVPTLSKITIPTLKWGYKNKIPTTVCVLWSKTYNLYFRGRRNHCGLQSGL